MGIGDGPAHFAAPPPPGPSRPHDSADQPGLGLLSQEPPPPPPSELHSADLGETHTVRATGMTRENPSTTKACRTHVLLQPCTQGTLDSELKTKRTFLPRASGSLAPGTAPPLPSCPHRWWADRVYGSPPPPPGAPPVRTRAPRVRQAAHPRSFRMVCFAIRRCIGLWSLKAFPEF